MLLFNLLKKFVKKNFFLLSNGFWTWGYEDIQHGGHLSFWNEENQKNLGIEIG